MAYGGMRKATTSKSKNINETPYLSIIQGGWSSFDTVVLNDPNSSWIKEFWAKWLMFEEIDTAHEFLPIWTYSISASSFKNYDNDCVLTLPLESRSSSSEIALLSLLFTFQNFHATFSGDSHCTLNFGDLLMGWESSQTILDPWWFIRGII